MKNLINRKVKHRESFRPYAPVVLAESAADYFKLSCPSPYMLLVAGVLEGRAAEIPAVVHVDGTARLQTVTESSNSLLYRLVKEFHRLTGVPVLLNTSFNTRGMPIVETPDDALDLFFDSAMDVLVIDRFVCDKAEKGTMIGLVRHYEANQKPARALTLMQKAVRKWPDDRSLYALLASCHHANGNYHEAIDAALMGDATEHGINLHLILGMSYEKIGDFHKAVPELKNAESVDPDNEQINVALTRCYRQTNQTELLNQEMLRGFGKVMKRSKGTFPRAYMAGIAVPTVFLLVIVTIYALFRFYLEVPSQFVLAMPARPLSRALVFPMAIVPNLWGAWNMLYLKLRSRAPWSPGAFGALLPLLLFPAGIALARALDMFTIQWWFALPVIPIAMAVYYLAWKYLVEFLNQEVGIA